MNRIVFLVFAILIIVTNTIGQGTKEVSVADKKKFLKFLQALPADGEFFTDGAVLRARPYIHILFGLTEEDIAAYDIYPFLALSRGFCDVKETREYGLSHFDTIRHPVIRLSWAAMLFDLEATSPEIIKYLRDALESKEQTKLLSQMVGPRYEAFRKRVLAYPTNKK
jgi:hypothetical protein